MSIFLGVDVGGTSIKVAACDQAGTLLTEELEQVETDRASLQAFIACQVRALGACLRYLKLGWKNVAAVGQATPGPCNDGLMEKTANLPDFLTGQNVRSLLEQALEQDSGIAIPVCYYNDGNAGAYAEWFVRSQRKSEKFSLVAIQPGTGLGAAYIDPNGNVLVGAHGCGMELGHVLLHPRYQLREYPCGCGRRGCIETMCSLQGLQHRLGTLTKIDESQSATEVLKTPGDVKQKALAVRTLAMRGDPLALRLFTEQAKALGYAAAVTALLVDPHEIVIGGGLADRSATTKEFRDDFVATAKATFQEHAFPVQANTPFSWAELGETAQGYGVALLARNRQH